MLRSEVSLLFVSLMLVLLGCSLVRLAGEAALAVWSDSGVHKPTKRSSCGCCLIFAIAAHLLGEAELRFVAVFFEECAPESDLVGRSKEELLSGIRRVCFLCNSLFPSFVTVSVAAMHKPWNLSVINSCGVFKVSEEPVSTSKLREPREGVTLVFLSRSATPGIKRSFKLFSGRLAQSLKRQEANLGEVFLSLVLQVKGL